MFKPGKEELCHAQTSPNGSDHDPVTVQTDSGKTTDVEAQGAHEKTSSSKALEGAPSQTTSSISIAQRSIHDEEKGLPVSHGAEKEPAVIDTEHDPNIVDWDGEYDPENPLNWSAKKKWYASS